MESENIATNGYINPNDKIRWLYAYEEEYFDVLKMYEEKDLDGLINFVNNKIIIKERGNMTEFDKIMIEECKESLDELLLAREMSKKSKIRLYFEYIFCCRV